jgi:hypothetical protein
MNEKRHGPTLPILLVFFGILISVVLFKSKMMCCEGEDKDTSCCKEDKVRIRHFGCCNSSKDFDESKDVE